jgi:hypothetical protein
VARELRIDRGTLRPPQKRADGSLLVEGVLTRTGVFTYRDSQGKERREYRPPDEVFKADSLDSFHLVPLTDDHPPELITAANAKRYAVGAVGAPRRDGHQMIAPLAVFDAATVAKVEGGKHELSNGYYADVVDEPGVSPEGERYDAVQRGICGNHVAIVDVARAGREARIRMDGAAVMVTDTLAREARADQGERMAKYKIDGVDFEVSEQAAQALARQDGKYSADLEIVRVRADKLEAERDAHKERADKAEKAVTDAAAAQPEQVRARVALETKAGAVLGPETKLDGMADREIRVAVIKKVCNVDVAAEKSDDYVSARYDAAVEQAERAAGALGAARGAVLPMPAHADGDIDEEAAARRMRERSANAWKNDADTEGK